MELRCFSSHRARARDVKWARKQYTCADPAVALAQLRAPAVWRIGHALYGNESGGLWNTPL